MTEMKLALVLYTYFCILQLARETNGEITPPWISSRGCYEWTPGSSSTKLSVNSPKNCFKECANLTHIGIQDDVCVCFANMPTTSRKPEHFCHSAQNIHVYSKVIEMPFNISQADYGYVYVSIQTFPSSMIFHASIDSSENHGIICTQDYSWNCEFRRGAAFNVNGEMAKSRCSPFSYFDLNNSCHCEDGDYWIGMYRETPMESSTNASTVVLPSTQQISNVSDNTPERFSQTDPSIRSTIKLTPSPITVTSSAYLLTNVVTSLQYPAPASPKVAAPVAVTFVAMLVVFASILICKKRKLLCFKERNKSVQTGEIDKALPTEILGMDPLIAVNVSSSTAPGSTRATLIGHPDNIRPIHSGQTCIQGRQYAGSNADNSDTDNHAELDRYTNGDHSVLNERTENPNVESRYDETIQSNRPTTASDVHAIVPLVQKKRTGTIHRSDEVQNELNANNSDSRKEETKKRKRSRKRKKRKHNTLFDVPADQPVVERPTNINN